MSAVNLLDIDVDELFGQRTISEIDQIQKKLEIEVEKKREELRTMVGERYRDLLKAADTIQTMKTKSTSVITEIDKIIGTVRCLNEKQLVGFRNYRQNFVSFGDQRSNDYSTMVEIKLLTDMPELIWSNFDDEKFFVATELFIFARHISTGLKLDTKNSFLQQLTVAEKQWEILKPFFFTIKQRCLSTLEREDLSSESTVDCLLALFILEKTPLDELLATLINIRSKAFLLALSSNQSAQRRVKDRILASLKVLNTTVDLIYKCFFENDGGHLVQSLRYFTSEERASTISLMNINDEVMLEALPDLITKFKPTFEVPFLTPESVKIRSEEWLKSISEVTKTHLSQVFELVSSMKTIQEIRIEALGIQKPSNWKEMCECLSLPQELDFYVQEYQPLLNGRIRDILRQSWLKCINAVHDEIKEMLRLSSKEDESRNYDFWRENSSEIPKSLKEAINQDKRHNTLLMKAKGFDPKIVQICMSFDMRLEEIFSEVSLFLEDDGGQVTEKQAIVNFLKDISHEHILQLITEIKSLKFEHRCKELVLLGRLFISFIELCPNLRLCLSHSYSASSWEKISGEKRNLEKWTKVCNLLEEESFQFWKQFCDVFLQGQTFEKTVGKSLTYETLLKDFVNWETIIIEEKDEEDNPIQSTIRIPCQPRISLQTHLIEIIQGLNNWIPQTLPRKVLLQLNTKLMGRLLEQFKNLMKNNFITSNQNMAIQLYFDLKFLQLLFIGHDDKITSDELQNLVTELKSAVDPFDFELFHPYLNTNIKKCAQRMQCQLGVLLPFPENLGILTDIKQQSSGLDKDPNVLSLSSNGSSTTWFPLLPIISPESKIIPVVPDVEKAQSTKSRKTESKLTTSQHIAQNYASNVKSGAAAFFGAMSQDWFR